MLQFIWSHEMDVNIESNIKLYLFSLLIKATVSSLLESLNLTLVSSPSPSRQYALIALINF